MGNFLLIICSADFQGGAGRLFRSGLGVAMRLNSQVASATVETEWARAASFPRWNGTGTPIVVDPLTGSWLLASGTWFHNQDYAVGSERRLLHRYLEVGEGRLAQELEGFFVLVIGDARSHETIVLTDIAGSCHCYIRVWKQAVAVSSSSVLLAALEDTTLDPVGCQEFLYTGIIYEDRTFFLEVRKLGPAAIFRFENGVMKSERRYWHIRNLNPESLNGRRAVTLLGEKLIRAAQKVGRTFLRPVCDLTGGYDSRALVAAFLTSGVRFSTTVSGPPESPDVVVSSSLASMLGLPHFHQMPRQELDVDDIKKAFTVTDGECDLIDYSRVLQVHQSLSERFDISLNGSFGEIARGYWWELLFPKTGACRELDAGMLARKRFASQAFDASFISPEIRLDLISHLAGVVERTNAGLSQFPNTLQMDHAYLAMRMQRWQGRIASSTNRLWPCLSLFLFRSVLETILQTAARLRQRSLLIRSLLFEFQPRLAELPLEHGYPAMPATWKNLYRFYPLLGYYGARILSKTARWMPGRQASLRPPAARPLRLYLWSNEEIQEIMKLAAVRLASLVDSVALENFLSRSRTQEFCSNDQWSRLLSLAYALHILDHIKVSPAS